MGFGYCKEIIKFGDDLGDNTTTFICGLIAGHKGWHRNIGNMDYSKGSQPYKLEWKNE